MRAWHAEEITQPMNATRSSGPHLESPLPRMKRKPYEKELRKLQVQLCQVQEWAKATGARIIIIFEGRDAAGKGGTIKALVDRVSPCACFRLVALPAPVRPGEDADVYAALHGARFPAAGK